MSPLMQSLGIDRLWVDERFILAHDIWKSIEEENSAVVLTDKQKMELDRRVADIEAHPENLLTWEEFERNIREQLKP